MWYAIQTITGKEEETVGTIRKVIPSEICENCFLLKREAIWRIQGSCKIHTERLFPGYVFVSTADPQEFYRQLKLVPQYTRILGKEEQAFYPVSPEEEAFLRELLNGDTEETVRLSTVRVDGQGNILDCGKPLRGYLDCVVKKRIRLRYVVIRVRLFGRKREILLGIRLEGDSQQT
jgi:transcription antitermination factor NusG